MRLLASRRKWNPREEVAAFINASPEEIIFTSCATESDNTAIRGAAEFFGRETKIITTAVEHPAVLQPCRRLKAQGHNVVELPVDSVGQIDLARLREELKGTNSQVMNYSSGGSTSTGAEESTEASASDSSTTYGTATATDNVNIRSEASTNGSVLGTLYPGQQVDVISTEGDWTHVKFTDPATGSTAEGYVSSSYLNVS